MLAFALVSVARRAQGAGPGRRHNIDRIRFELCDPFGFDGAASSEHPHNALSDAAALRAFILKREGLQP